MFLQILTKFRLVSKFGQLIGEISIDFPSTGFIHLAILGIFIGVDKHYGATCGVCKAA